jgi:hypothetical protein
MGVVIDTGVFIRWEREGGIIEFSRWSSLGEPCISVITESELKVGIHRANTRERRERRSLFVQTVLSNVVVLPIDSRVTDNQCCGIPSRAKFASHSVPKRYFQIGPPDSRWSDLSWLDEPSQETPWLAPERYASVDRQSWVPLAELAEGETLQGLDGLATVLSVNLSRVTQPVYNIEVHGEHVYQVGKLGLVVHNTRPGDILQTGDRTIHKSTARTLNDFLEVSLHSREWGRSLEKLKKF